MLDRTRRRQRQLRLLDLYGSLLTEHQRHILHLAWELDWSYGEIAAKERVSRTAIYDVVRRTTVNLDDYERKLGLERAQRV
ncbi:MAG TPA: RNA polymerase subunit sigma-70 [Candidatus Dormibacteraeota bacterium]|nr:RNA polymerase subunit sigma-70 [Candidatus Dormibacteraeota bacterium]